MTEAEWWGCNEPWRLLQHFGKQASQRKARLFAAGCFRRVWHLLTDEHGRWAVETAEQLADGGVRRAQLDDPRYEPIIRSAKAGPALAANAHDAAHRSSWAAAQLAVKAAPLLEGGVFAKERAGQVALIRDLLGPLPFRPVAADPAWLRWSDGTVLKVAQAIYAGRHFEDLPILADALEDAGCDNEDVLSHCRQRGSHARGCWVIDLLLQKE